jgi:hypothetical protein
MASSSIPDYGVRYIGASIWDFCNDYTRRRDRTLLWL